VIQKFQPILQSYGGLSIESSVRVTSILNYQFAIFMEQCGRLCEKYNIRGQSFDKDDKETDSL